MSPLTPPTREGRWLRVSTAALFALALALGACIQKISRAECDHIAERYAELVIGERLPDAGPELAAAERERERSEAQRAEFRSCTSQVQKREYDCAMQAPTAEAVIRCLD